jgi:hypothetical protein
LLRRYSPKEFWFNRYNPRPFNSYENIPLALGGLGTFTRRIGGKPSGFDEPMREQSQESGENGSKKYEISLSTNASQPAREPPPVFYRLGIGISAVLGWAFAVSGLYSWATRGGSGRALILTWSGFLIGLLGQSRLFWFDVWNWTFAK